MNREIKRQMKREQKAAERTATRGRRPAMQAAQKRERIGFRQWIREIHSELRRVIWPSTQEVVTYSVVVVVVVSLLTGVVFLMDMGFFRAVVELFRPAAGG